MPKARPYQDRLEQSLVLRFGRRLVRSEWSIAAGATDSFSRSVGLYVPRLDLAVGPFNVDPGTWDHAQRLPEIPSELRLRLPTITRQNPRCLLAIEVVFSGSSKHVLGDLTNASMMGLYGAVVAHPSMVDKAKRILEYGKRLHAVGKSQDYLFANTEVFSSEEFIGLLG